MGHWVGQVDQQVVTDTLLICRWERLNEYSILTQQVIDPRKI